METVMEKRDSENRTMTWIIVVAVLLLFATLGIHTFSDGTYETRTVAATTLRSTVWIVISILLYRQLMHGYHDR